MSNTFKVCILFAFLILTSQCKIVESSVAQTTKVPKSPRATTLGSDECVVNAKVLRMMEPGIYSLRIYEVTEVGYQYTGKISAGDKINVRMPTTLPEGEVIDLTLQWIGDATDGYFEVVTGAQ